MSLRETPGVQEATIAMYRALKVVAWNPTIRGFLQENDPKALEQVLAAIKGADRLSLFLGTYEHREEQGDDAR